MPASSLPDFPPRDDGAVGPAHATSAAGPLGVTLRGATAADLPFLRRLYGAGRAAELAPVPWPAATKQAFLDQQFALQHRHYLGHYPDADFALVERAGQPLGRYYVRRAAPDFLLIDISLDPAAQGQGIGRWLIAQTQDEAAARGCGMRLHVHHDNAGACRLYQRLGFVAADADDAAGYLPMRWRAAS